MKEIIDEKTYDTNLAFLIGSYTYEPDEFFKDPFPETESLYQIHTGDFFLYCEKETSFGFGDKKEKIYPLIYEEASDWAKKHLKAEKYFEVFGMSDNKKQNDNTMTITLSESTALFLQQAAEKTGMSIDAYVDNALHLISQNELQQNKQTKSKRKNNGFGFSDDTWQSPFR